MADAVHVCTSGCQCGRYPAFTQLHAAQIYDGVKATLAKVDSGVYTVAEALLEIHCDIDNWSLELRSLVDRHTLTRRQS